MNDIFSSTIAAISTPRGRGGIAVIRISGGEALAVASRFVMCKTPLKELTPRKATLCRIEDTDGVVLDDALVTVFFAPHSYTGEDVVEISCHGGETLCREIISAAFRCGAKPAEAGEFTRRAFSAGKLTLTEAEAVIGVIDAKSRAGIALSRKNLDGALSRETDKIYEKLKVALGSVYAGMDFPDEELETLDANGMERHIDEAVKMLEGLMSSYKMGHAVCEGVPTVICGKPNVGKSTLMNTVLGTDRAIVTSIPGTTRDVISETAVMGDITLSLRDTAGIRRAGDEIEKMGISRAFSEVENCELAIGMFDGSRPFDDDDAEVLKLLEGARDGGKNVIFIINKCDLEKKFDIKRLGDVETVEICAKDKNSKGAVEERIRKIFANGATWDDGAVITNARQYASVERALGFCNDAKEALKAYGADVAGIEIERAMSEISQMDGREVNIDIVNEIFGKFCVGK